jgi:hypothetical protein
MDIAKVITRITLDMHSNSKNPVVYAKQGDRATRYIIATLVDGSDNYNIPADSTVVLNATKPDGTCIYNACTYSGSEVTTELTSQMLAVSGTVTCDIEVKSSDSTQLITSATFTLAVSRSQRSDNQIESKDEFTLLDEDLQILSNRITAADEATRKATAATTSAATATDNANKAATSADSAADKCTTATKEAQTATEAATSAIASCKNATGRAEEALQNQEELNNTLEEVKELKAAMDDEASRSLVQALGLCVAGGILCQTYNV